MKNYYSKLQDKLNNLITFKNPENEWTFIVCSIILTIILLFSFSLYFYEEIFLKTSGFYRRLSFGIVLGFLICAVIYISFLIRVFKKAHKKIEEVSKLNSNEDKFNFFFNDEKYSLFIKLCIENKLIDKTSSSSYKWLKEATDYAVLYHKLKENNFFKERIKQKDFVMISKEYFNIEKLDSSLITKYKPTSENFLLGGYQDFYKSLNYFNTL
ncbi:hypothetical protein [Flavobacterium sp.]|uniref:hypothetical protein n=1 Tax=Flavobacterium sp. TaxID=239 RepID=UPI004048B771